MAEVSIGVSSVIPMALLMQQLYCTAAQLLQEIDQHLSLLVQGLVKARSDAVDGDGAATSDRVLLVPCHYTPKRICPMDT
jgi:hypothetical protein